MDGRTMETDVESSSQNPQERPNPMLNSLVLQNLFEHASIKDIKTYRQVCRLWWEESLSRWRCGVWVRLADDVSNTGALYLEDYLNRISGSASSDPYQFGKHPYRNLKLDRYNLSLVERQLEFWSQCGPHMKRLEISNSHFRSVDDFKAILFRLIPNVIFLHLNDNTISPRRLDEVNNIVDLKCGPAPPKTSCLEKLCISRDEKVVLLSPRSWVKFLSQFPLIKSLNIVTRRLYSSSYSVRQELADILNAMMTLATDEGLSWNLEKLDLLFMGALRDSVLQYHHSELLQQLQLPLTTLCLHIEYETLGALKPILETCGYTLRKLVVYSAGNSTNQVVPIENNEVERELRRFPFGVQLDTLSELWLSGRLLCDNLNFLPFTPNLTSLILAQDVGNSLLAAGSHVSGEETWKRIADLLDERPVNHRPPVEAGNNSVVVSLLEGTDFSRLDHFVCPNLKEFVVSGVGNPAYDANVVAALSKLMPNLKTLMLGMGNDSFRVACECWKQMEVLIIQPYKVDQFGLTGNVPLVKHRFPNLSDLTNIRYFGMGFEKLLRNSETSLSEEAILNAIFPLKNLQGITAFYDKNQMTMGVRRLLSKFPYSRIHAVGDQLREWRFNGAEGNESLSEVESEEEQQEEEYSDDEYEEGSGSDQEEDD